MKYEIIKGSAKDFEGAPEWCTHVSKSSASGSLAWEVSGITKDGNKYQWVDSASGDDCIYSGSNDIILEIIAERRPITEPVVNQQLTTEWDGTGIAHLGQHVEYFWGEGKEWRKAEVVAHYEECPLLKDIEDGLMVAELNNKMRPIRSPETVARDEAIDAMRDVVLASDQSLTCYESLYDAIAAGKIKGVLTLSSLEELVAKGHYPNLVINK